MKSRRCAWNQLFARYAAKGSECEDINFSSSSDNEVYNSDPKKSFYRVQDEAKESTTCQSKSSSEYKLHANKLRNIDKDPIPRNVRQNKKIKVCKLLKIVNIEKSTSSRKLFKLDTTKQHNSGFLSKVNAKLPVKSQFKNSRINFNIVKI